MARKYRYIKGFEQEILELKKKGYRNREIGQRLGFEEKSVEDFITRYNRKQRQIAEGKYIENRVRPSEKNWELPPSVQNLDKIAQMRYVMASKDRYIERLKMEIELMQDFLLLTERM